MKTLMKKITVSIILSLLLTINLSAQNIILTPENLQPTNVFMSLQKQDGENVLRITKDAAIIKDDEPTYVKIKDFDFKDGTIEVKVLSRLLPDAPVHARGFIGLTFHINVDNSEFESIYVRPTNARADDQVRRNHSIQYFAYPYYKYDRLRKESPEKYESYADMELNKWITLRIEVEGEKARLYIDNHEQPSLIVNDLKLGGRRGGAIGMFVDIGTEGFFKDLKVTKR